MKFDEKRLNELMKKIEPLTWQEVDEFNELKKLEEQHQEEKRQEKRGHLVNGKVRYGFTGDEDDENFVEYYNGPIKVGEGYET